MPVLENVPESDINDCLRAIHAFGATEKQFDYLISVPPYQFQTNQDYREMVRQISLRLLRAVCKGEIMRWDFDPGDNDHRGYPHTKLDTTWQPPEEWSGTSKRYIVYGINGCYRGLCRSLVEELCMKFERVRDSEQLRLLAEDAKSKGVIAENGGRLVCNPSILYSDRVVKSYQSARTTCSSRRSPAQPAEMTRSATTFRGSPTTAQRPEMHRSPASPERVHDAPARPTMPEFDRSYGNREKDRRSHSFYQQKKRKDKKRKGKGFDDEE